MKNTKKAELLLSVFKCICTFLLIITVSIGLPIYFRPFYYAHIEPLGLAEISGYSESDIKAAYNEVLDYLTLPNKEFSVGNMKYSDEGAAHFADCKVLFDLNATVLILSAFALILICIIAKIKKLQLTLGKHDPSFFGAIGAIVIPIAVGALAAADFDRAFVVFHSIFFPGKDNWIFDPKTDEIIKVLPQDFFMHCAILIGCGILVISLTVIITDKIKRKRKEKK